MSKLGDYIRERRRQLNKMTQVELSTKLGDLGEGRKAGTIANWETGRNDVPVSIIPALARALEEPSPFHLYDLLGVIDNIPGSQIVRALNSAPIEKIDRIQKYIAMVMKDEL